MADKLWQVLLTYLTRRYFWLLGGAALLFALPLLLAGFGGDFARSDFNPMLPLGLGYTVYVLAFFMVGQGKRQFAHPRARLMPGFTWPHLLPILAMAFSAAVLLPLIFTWVAASGPWGLLAYCGCLTAALVWSLHRSDMAIMLVAGLIYFSVYAPSGLAFWGLVPGGVPSPLVPPLAVAGWLALAAYPLRLTRLHEELPDYGGLVDVVQFDVTARGERVRRQQVGVISRRWMFGTWSIADWWHDRLAKIPATAAASPGKLRCYGFGATPAWVSALFLVAVLTVLSIFFSSRESVFAQNSRFGGLPVSLVIFAMMALVMPGASGFLLLLQRWPRLQGELLRPHNREDFVSNLFRAVVENLLQLDTVLLVWFLATFAVFGRQRSDIVYDISVFLLLGMSIQAFCLALGLYVVAVSRGFATLMGYGLACWLLVLALMPTWLELRDNVGDAPFLIAAAALLVVAALTWQAARRRWLQAEFGA